MFPKSNGSVLRSWRGELNTKHNRNVKKKKRFEGLSLRETQRLRARKREIERGAQRFAFVELWIPSTCLKIIPKSKMTPNFILLVVGY